jgi:hypothetical protein
VNLAERLAELNDRLFERTVQVLLGCPLGCGASEHLTQVLSAFPTKQLAHSILACIFICLAVEMPS